MNSVSKLQLLKKIDHWAGLPLCVVAGILTAPFKAIGRKRVASSRQLDRILLIKFFGLGSITIIFSLLESVRKSHPKAKIYFLTFKGNKKFIEDQGICDEIITIDESGAAAFCISLAASLARLMKIKADAVVDLEYFAKFSTLLSSLCGLRRRIAFYLPHFWKRSLIDLPVHLNFSSHILDIYGYICGLLFSDTRLKRAGIVFKPSLKVDKILEAFCGKLIVGVNINASKVALCRRVPLEFFKELCLNILEKYPQTHLLLLGSADEKEYVSSLGRMLKDHKDGAFSQRITNSAGMFDLRELVYILSRMRLCLSVDSGTLQFCYSLKVPTVSFWGPGSPVTHGPYGKEEELFHRVIYTRWPCSPCLYLYRTEPAYFCANRADCVRAMDVDFALSQVAELLEEG